jgi:hypothetical protein
MGPSFTLAGHTLSQALGTVFSYNPTFTSYGPDTAASGAPSDAARFLLGAGYLDLRWLLPTEDTAVAVTVMADTGSSPIATYSVSGFERARAYKDSSRFNAGGSIATSLGAVELTTTVTDWTNEREFWRHTERISLRVPDGSELWLYFEQNGWRSDSDTRGAARISLTQAGGLGPVTVELEYSHARCHPAAGAVPGHGHQSALGAVRR